jgi:hypothetical protein
MEIKTELFLCPPWKHTGEWAVRLMLRPLYPFIRGSNDDYSLNMRVDGAQRWFGRFWEDKNSLPEVSKRKTQSVFSATFSITHTFCVKPLRYSVICQRLRPSAAIGPFAAHVSTNIHPPPPPPAAINSFYTFNIRYTPSRFLRTSFNISINPT